MSTLQTGMRRQRGVALLVTMIILVAVTMIGLTALRAGFLHVAMATNSQVSTILFQGADAVTQTLEETVNADKAKATQVTGILGMVSPDVERSSCLTTDGFQQATVAASSTCTFTGATPKYMSGRGLVAAQVTLTTPFVAGGGGGGAMVDGSDTSNLALKYVAYSTAVMPAFGSATPASAQACMGNRADDASDPAGIVTISECLNNAGASYTTTAQEYFVGLSGKPTIK